MVDRRSRGFSGWRGGRPSVRQGFCGVWLGDGTEDGVSPVDDAGGCGLGVVMAVPSLLVLPGEFRRRRGGHRLPWCRPATLPGRPVTALPAVRAGRGTGMYPETQRPTDCLRTPPVAKDHDRDQGRELPPEVHSREAQCHGQTECKGHGNRQCDHRIMPGRRSAISPLAPLMDTHPP